MGNITTTEVHELASFISVLAVALIGVQIVLLPHAWKRFKIKYLDISISQKRWVWAVTALELVYILGAFIAFSLIEPPQSLWVLNGVLIMIYMVVGWTPVYFIRMRRMNEFESCASEIAKAVKHEHDDVILDKMKKLIHWASLSDYRIMFWNFGASLFLFMGIVCTFLALLTISSVALNMEWLPGKVDDFLWGKWLLLSGIGLFGFSMACYGMSYAFEGIANTVDEHKTDKILKKWKKERELK